MCVRPSCAGDERSRRQYNRSDDRARGSALPVRQCLAADARLERGGSKLNRHRALDLWWSMIPRVGPEGMLFGKPASTPDQVRGRLFPDDALGAGALDLVFGSAGGEQFHRLRAVE